MHQLKIKACFAICLLLLQINSVLGSSFQNKIGTITYGSNADSCYQQCERGEICKIENSKTVCTPYCGDGIVVGKQKEAKGCDDGNNINSDGCTKCVIDVLYTCQGEPSVCAPTCGNGVLETSAGQQCDDGNSNSIDGCTQNCKISIGWGCSTVPSGTSGSAQKSQCSPICGDGLLVGSEFDPTKCDDKNKKDGDGCSSKCEVENQWTCCNVPSVCKKKCGNGIFDTAAGEECDDGNTDENDGCFSNCKIDAQHWTCSSVAGFASKCSGICGDGALVGNQKGNCRCDDGNTFDKDGCMKNCTVEPGWTCSGQPSVCSPICGDGLLVGSQLSSGHCDDFNNQHSDGCYNCKVQPLFQCHGQPSMCERKCGNYKFQKQFGEQCDNGDSQVSDGCSNRCKVQQGWQCESQPGKQSICKSSLIHCKKSAPFPANYCYTLLPSLGCKNCEVVDGWQCKPIDSQYFECSPICGNNKVEGNQVNIGKCDSSSQGCKNCNVVPGWTCFNTLGKQSVCIPICGDGIVVGPQLSQCDDGNSVNGDGCSSTCLVQPDWACSIVNGKSRCIRFNTCIKRQNKDPYCFIDCSKLFYNTFQLKQDCQNTYLYCNDFNSQPNDGCTDCRLDPSYISSETIIVPSKTDPKREGYRITYPSQCGNEKIDKNQICDYSVLNKQCHAKCNYKDSKCGSFITEMEEQCDYFWGCLRDCKGFQDGWTKASISGQGQNSFMNPKRSEDQRSQNWLTPQLSKYWSYIEQILTQYYRVVEYKNYDLSFLSWQDMQQLFRINGAYFSPGTNLEMYNPVKLTIELFVARLGQMEPGTKDIKFYYNTPSQKQYLTKIMSEVLTLENTLNLNVFILERTQILKRHY